MSSISSEHPTPAEARALTELARGTEIIITNRGVIWSNSYAKHRSGNIKMITVQALIRNGWVQPRIGDFSRHEISEIGAEVEAELEHRDLAPVRKLPMTAPEIVKVLRKHHPFPEWVIATEVSAENGLHYIDVLAVSGKKHQIAYEIKISRADFIFEIEHPSKRAWAMMMSSQFFFAAPAGLIAIEEVPKGCGLVEVWEKGRLTETVPAPESKPQPPDWRMLSAFGRALVRD